MVFGNDKERRNGFRNPASAIKMVVELCIEHPEGKEKRRIRKFAVDFAQYVHTEGTRRESMHEDGNSRVEPEFFCGLM